MTVAAVGRRHVLDEALTAIVDRLRTAGPSAFGRVFLPALLSGAPSPLHDELDAWHRREVDRDPGAMDAFAAPRGHGKSVGGVEIPALWHVAYCHRRFIVIASDTHEQAADRLRTIITAVEQSDELRAAFPNLRPAIDDRGQVVRWRDDDLIFACGCRIMAVGAGKAIRGARHGATRPDLLLLDDLEDEDSVRTDAALEKRLRWIQRVALGLAGPKRGISALWVGTILSRRALLNQATGAALEEGQGRPEWARPWRSHVYAAELPDTPTVATRVLIPNPETELLEPVLVESDRGLVPLTYLVGQPLWTELTREDLARIRYNLGALSYAAEYLSDPADDSTGILARPRPAAWLNPTASPLARLVKLPSGRLVPVAAMTRAAALDPQYAEPTDGSDPDLAAIAVVGVYQGETFLLDSWVGRDRHGQAGRLIDLGIRWGVFAVGVEKVGAQAVTADAAAADGRLPVMPMPPPGDRGLSKIERATPLAVRLGERDRPETCRVWTLPDAEATGMEPLTSYLERFPHGRYDDPVDAVVYAAGMAARAAGPTASTSGPRTA